MVTFLVTGNPGSGKTALSLELTRRGVAAVDGDVLAGWESQAGEPVVQPDDASDGWLSSHRWVWVRERLLALVERYEHGVVFVCGIAMNQRDMLDLFDAVFLLSIDERTQVARLEASGDRNTFEREQVVRGRPFLEAEMRAVGARVVDGEQPTVRIADVVLAATATALHGG